MKPILILVLSSSMVASHCPELKAGDRAKSIERAQVELLSARHYCELLLAAGRAGNRYSLEERRSGLKRHYLETQVQLLERGYRILDSEKHPGRIALARASRTERIWWRRLKDCFGE